MADTSVSMLVLRLWDHHVHAAKVNGGYGVSILGVRRWENITYTLEEVNGG